MKFDVKMITALLALVQTQACKTSDRSGLAGSGRDGNLIVDNENLPLSQLVSTLVALEVKEISEDGTFVIPTKDLDKVEKAASKDGVKIEKKDGFGLAESPTTEVKLVDSTPVHISTPTFKRVSLFPTLSTPAGIEPDPSLILTSSNPALNRRIEDLLRGNSEAINPSLINPSLSRGGQVSAEEQNYHKTFDKADYSNFDRTVGGGDKRMQALFETAEFDRLKLPRSPLTQFEKIGTPASTPVRGR
ncbi:MAG: hypothetical protein EOP04_08570 [Proteobacteria bacterium]|nr:MAG: hypothetical protein EOP04_08570 [Pseudomonadota bacterium]